MTGLDGNFAYMLMYAHWPHLLQFFSFPFCCFFLVALTQAQARVEKASGHVKDPGGEFVLYFV